MTKKKKNEDHEDHEDRATSANKLQDLTFAICEIRLRKALNARQFNLTRSGNFTEEVGFALSSLGNKLNDRSLTVAELLTVAGHLGVSVGWLLGETDELGANAE